MLLVVHLGHHAGPSDCPVLEPSRFLLRCVYACCYISNIPKQQHTCSAGLSLRVTISTLTTVDVLCCAVLCPPGGLA
jgi:hypothetical protein